MKQPDLRIGTRILHRPSKRTAMVIGWAEKDRPTMTLIKVHFEGSTRSEYVPTHLITALPKTDQFKRLGGKVQAPAGYPLVPIN